MSNSRTLRLYSLANEIAQHSSPDFSTPEGCNVYRELSPHGSHPSGVLCFSLALADQNDSGT